MLKKQHKTWHKTVVSLLGVAGTSVLLSLPAMANHEVATEENPTGEPGVAQTMPLPNESAPSMEESAPSMEESATTSEETIAEIASGNDAFTTLVAALEAAGLVETLMGEGPYTVFAPTDEAFAALPEGTLEELLKPENRDRLVELLTYHVVPGSVSSGDLESGEVTTVAGEPIMVEVNPGAVMVNDASVIQADIPASNGVIHVIDKVIMPPADMMAPSGQMN